MPKARTIGTMLCLGALTALPACSMFGDSGSSSGGQYRQSSYGGGYNTASAVPMPPPGTSVTGQAAITPEMIRDVQGRLQQANLYPGRVDGVWGPMTERGVHDWQQSHGMSPSGQLDMATLQSMNVATYSNQYGQASGTTQPDYSTAGTQPTGGSYSSSDNPPMNPSTGNQPAPSTNGSTATQPNR